MLLFVEPPSGSPTIDPETYNGDDGTWVSLPMEERLDDGLTDQAVVNPGYDWTTDGVASWAVDIGALWTDRQASTVFPETGALPPSQPQLFWVRLNNTGTVPLVIDRLLPVYYTTYTNPNAVARYLGQRDFDDLDQPFLHSIRERIHTQEDVLDNYLRMTYRLGMAINERHHLDPWGVKLNRRPVIEVTGVHVWSGTNYQVLNIGRNQDVYVDPTTSILYFTRLSTGMVLPWTRPSALWMNQPGALMINYIYGGDFDLSPIRGLLREIVINRVAASLAVVDGETAYFPNSRDLVTKPEQVEIWNNAADAKSEQIRGLAMA